MQGIRLKHLNVQLKPTGCNSGARTDSDSFADSDDDFSDDTFVCGWDKTSDHLSFVKDVDAKADAHISSQYLKAKRPYCDDLFTMCDLPSKQGTQQYGTVKLICSHVDNRSHSTERTTGSCFNACEVEHFLRTRWVDVVHRSHIS